MDKKKEPAHKEQTLPKKKLYEKTNLLFHNFLSGNTVVGDDADIVNTVGKIAHVDGADVLFGHDGAAVNVDDADFLHALGLNVQDIGDGVRIELHIGVGNIADASVLTGNNLKVVNQHPVDIGAVVMTESDVDVLTGKSGEVKALEVIAGLGSGARIDGVGEVSSVGAGGGNENSVEVIRIFLLIGSHIIVEGSTFGRNLQLGSDHPVVGR